MPLDRTKDMTSVWSSAADSRVAEPATPTLGEGESSAVEHALGAR